MHEGFQSKHTLIDTLSYQKTYDTNPLKWATRDRP